jgi:hypothetical protein
MEDVELHAVLPADALQLHPQQSAQAEERWEHGVVKMVGFRNTVGRECVWWCIVVFTGGLAALIAYWRPDWELFARNIECDLRRSQRILITRDDGHRFVEKVVRKEVGPVSAAPLTRAQIDACTATDVLNVSHLFDSQPVPSGTKGRSSRRASSPRGLSIQASVGLISYFEHRHLRYIFNVHSEKFGLYEGIEKGQSFEKLHKLARLPEADAPARTLTIALNGFNTIDVEVKGYIHLLFKEVLHPFFVFQLLAITLWVYEHYVYYALCILFVSMVSIIVSLIETRKNLVRLRKMVLFHGSVHRLTTPLGSNVEDYEIISCDNLVPGDVFMIPPEGMTMSCDAVVLTSGCVVNESMLTGR